MTTRDHLTEQRQGLITYLTAKVKAADWHAVADAAMDLREIEAQIDLLEEQADALSTR